MDLDTSSRWCCHQKALAWDSAWLSNLFGESDEARFEGSHTNWVTDSGRYLMKMVHNCSSNRQIGMILEAKCSYCICLQLVLAMLPCIHTRNSHIDVLKYGVMFWRKNFTLWISTYCINSWKNSYAFMIHMFEMLHSLSFIWCITIACRQCNTRGNNIWNTVGGFIFCNIDFSPNVLVTWVYLLAMCLV